MGLLSYNPYDPYQNPMMRNITPFVQPQMTQGQGAGPPIAQPQPQAPVQQQQQPQPGRMQSAWRGLLGTSNLAPDASWSDKINATMDGPLFNTGLALIASSSPGATGADFANAMQGYRQQQLGREQLRRQNSREDAADQRESTAFARQQTDWQRQDEQNSRWRAAVEAETNPQRRSQLQAVGPAGYADYIAREQEVEFQRERARVQDSQFAQSLGVDYARLNQDRYNNSFAAAAGREEAGYVAGMRGRLDNWRMVDNDISRIEMWLNKRPDVFQSLLDGTEEEVLRRYTRRGDPEALSAAQELYAIGASLAREELRGQTPVSNIDLLAAMRSNPSTASSPQFVRSWLERARADRQMMEQQYQAALQHGQQFGNLSAVNPATGRNYYQETYTRYGDGERPQEAPRGPRERWADYYARTGGGGGGASQTQPSSATAPARGGNIRPGTVENGWRFNGGDPSNPRNWRYVGGNR